MSGPHGEEDQISNALASVREWVQSGLLDGSWVGLLEAAFRRATDDTYDPDARVGGHFVEIEGRHRDDRADIASLLEIVYGHGIHEDGTDDDVDTINEITDRIGWSPA